jgi:hypothetical protein
MRLSAILLFFICSISLKAQTWAVTQKGDTIYIYDDGTWSFDKNTFTEDKNGLNYLNESIEYDTISTPFTVLEKGKKKISSKYGFFEIYYDESIWKRVPPAQLNEDAEFAFQGKESDVYVAVITEEIEIGFENIYKIAKNNIEENLSVPVNLLKSEIRTVNNTQLIRGVMNFNLNGMNLVFDSYYFSGKIGTVQFTTWTATNLHSKYESQILDLLNGIVIKGKDD